MLYHSLLEPASGVYVEQLSLTLRGDLDVAAFEQVWRQVTRRHATLRTAFVWEGLDEPLQLVRRRAEARWEHVDLRGLPADEQQRRSAAYLRADRERGFALPEAPLMRMWLGRLTDETRQFVWSFHHLLLDGWSLPIILEEVLSAYEASRGAKVSKADSGRPYIDYINWLGQQDTSRAEAFWRRYLEGFRAPTSLVADGVARTGTATEVGHDEQQTRIPPAEAARVQAFARQHHLTLNTVLQGTWALLLSRYSGEPEVVFGVTVSGRPPELAGVEKMVGSFINTVPVRIKTPADAPAASWLRELQERQAELRSRPITRSR
jgi:hypothetical protein